MKKYIWNNPKVSFKRVKRRKFVAYARPFMVQNKPLYNGTRHYMNPYSK